MRKSKANYLYMSSINSAKYFENNIVPKDFIKSVLTIQTNI